MVQIPVRMERSLNAYFKILFCVIGGAQRSSVMRCEVEAEVSLYLHVYCRLSVVDNQQIFYVKPTLFMLYKVNSHFSVLLLSVIVMHDFWIEISLWQPCSSGPRLAHISGDCQLPPVAQCGPTLGATNAAVRPLTGWSLKDNISNSEHSSGVAINFKYCLIR